MTEWYGTIKILKTSSEHTILPATVPDSDISFIEMKDNNVRFVHYPDCQQLTIWLTHPGREYGSVRLKDKNTNIIIEQWPVSDRLNGSIQLLWDTLYIAPGSYVIEIDWKNGWQHRIEFIKQEESFTEEKKIPVPLLKKDDAVSKPIIYRDGFGKIIEDTDLVLQAKLKKEIAGKFTRRLEYEGHFRAGNIFYIEGDIKIRFSHEMGGGNCMVYIDIPTEKQWEAQTKTALSRRKDIIDFVANTVNREQASNCRFEIADDSITYYYR